MDQRCPHRVAGVAGAAVADGEGEDAGLRRASRDAGDGSRALSQRAQLATGMFHEELSPARRDTEVARFRELDGPSLLVSTECGGEGRNFEFCRRLVLFDLPWKPSVVEQRIGRLDRIGRRIPVEVGVLSAAGGIGRDVVRLFEELGLFREPLAGLEPQLAPVEGALEAIALDPDASLSERASERSSPRRTRRARASAKRRISNCTAIRIGRRWRPAFSRGSRRSWTSSTRKSWSRPRSAWASPSRIRRGHRVFSIELGSGAAVDGLPGVPAGSGYVGTFDREEAVENEFIDFFASGHPLVEGIFAHYEESAIGRAVRFEMAMGTEASEGLVAIYKDGPRVRSGRDRRDRATPGLTGRRPSCSRPISGPRR